MSTGGGAATKAIMNTDTAVKRVGIMIIPNILSYILFSVDITHSQKLAHRRKLPGVLKFFYK